MGKDVKITTEMRKESTKITDNAIHCYVLEKPSKPPAPKPPPQPQKHVKK